MGAPSNRTATLESQMIPMIQDVPGQTLRVRCRSKSGSLVHGRISGGISVLGKSAQPLLVVARRGMASKRNGARGLLPPARAVDQDVRTLDEAYDQQGRNPRTSQ